MMLFTSLISHLVLLIALFLLLDAPYLVFLYLPYLLFLFLFLLFFFFLFFLPLFAITQRLFGMGNNLCLAKLQKLKQSLFKSNQTHFGLFKLILALKSNRQALENRHQALENRRQAIIRSISGNSHSED